MTLKTKIMLWLGSVFAAFAAAVLIVPSGGRELWAPVVLASAGFAYFAFAFESVRWAFAAVPAFIATAAGLNYFRAHRDESTGISILIAVIVLNAAILLFKVRQGQAASH